MDDVISLSVGEPDFVTPWRIREAGIYAIEHGFTAYTSNSGLPKLIQAISEHLNARYQVSYEKDQILITVGVSEGLDLALRAILNSDDEVIYAEPCYVSYAPGIRFAGGVAVPAHTHGDDGFRIHPEDIEAAITPKTKALLLCYPNNPTGATQNRDDLQRIVDIAVKHDLYIISDEIYDRLTYIGKHTCISSLNGAMERTILLNGFSKAYAMTGWRIAYACAPKPIAENMLKIHQYTMLCASHMVQLAALEAIQKAGNDVEEMVADYDHRRRLFVQGLNEIGMGCIEPKGAFYAFPSIRHTGMTSEQFASELLMEERVAVVPGNAFGPSGEGYVRCCYATALSQLEEALERMGRFMHKVKLERQPTIMNSEALKI